jgi:hypothetical protein
MWACQNHEGPDIDLQETRSGSSCGDGGLDSSLTRSLVRRRHVVTGCLGGAGRERQIMSHINSGIVKTQRRQNNAQAPRIPRAISSSHAGGPRFPSGGSREVSADPVHCHLVHSRNASRRTIGGELTFRRYERYDFLIFECKWAIRRYLRFYTANSMSLMV